MPLSPAFQRRLERALVDEIASEATLAGSHDAGDAQQQIALVPEIERCIGQFRVGRESHVDLPLVKEQPRALLVKLSAVAREILRAIEDCHHGEQKRIASELADGDRVGNCASEEFAFHFAGACIPVCSTVPAVEEIGDLIAVELLQHEVTETFVAPRLVLVANDARGDEDAGTRVVVGKTMDGSGNLPTQRGVEDFVETIEKNKARGFLQPYLELGLFEMPAHAACTTMQILEDQHKIFLTGERHKIHAKNLDEHEARKFRLPVGSAVLVVEGPGFTQSVSKKWPERWI
jgi:hypothetical protein